MTWTPPHNNFTTFVKDGNNIYIKCADGSWVVLTLSTHPTGPYGGGGQKPLPRYIYSKETWEIIGTRAFSSKINSNIIGDPLRTELDVIGIMMVGTKSEEGSKDFALGVKAELITKNVFELSGIFGDRNNKKLEVYGTASTHLEKEFYAIGVKKLITKNNVPVLGNKTESIEETYEFTGTISDEELLELLVSGVKTDKSEKIVLASGRTSESLKMISGVEGDKVSCDVKEVRVIGKKDFKKILNVLLMEI